MNVSLTPELEKFVREKVASGLYNNSSEVVREALRLLYRQAGPPPPNAAAISSEIRRIAPLLRQQGVSGLALFGSAARGEARPDSDIDILIDVDPKAAFGLLEQAGIKLELEKALGRQVDVVLRSALRSELRNSVLADTVQVF
jgi:putative addiction module CopG family antidote